ncbi:MAG TPA: ATP-binding protein [Candidatus Saccharimonadales bacterium]|nr:ATP-binding protein [Candidatus Saccharimonadales bacterium]
MPGNNWYVITGGPSVGKTTLLAELEKLGHSTLPEGARIVIDNGIARGLTIDDIRADEQRFQLDVLAHKIRTELEQDREALTFFDRGMHDTLAYLRLFNFEVTDEVTEAMKNADYRHVFLLEPLDAYITDYARTESREEALKLNELLAEAYSEYGMKPTVIPALPPEERARLILKHLEEMEQAV